MAGTLLSPNQIAALNAAFPALVLHIRALLSADHSGYGLMRVHSQVESFDSDEMVAIFHKISFITPMEKKALVRAAIYELMAAEPELFVSPLLPAGVTTRPFTDAEKAALDAAPKTFTPPQFKLNVATSDAAEVAHTDTKPSPVVTSTHIPKVAEALKAGAAEQKAQTDKLAAAVKALREESVSPVVDVAPELDAPIEE